MEGYAKVAQLMGAQDEFAIFRGFRALNMRNLLYMQAEITHLEAELQEIARRDAVDRECADYAFDWWSMSIGEGQNGDEQWEKVQEIRDKLEKYSRLHISFWRRHHLCIRQANRLRLLI